MLLGVLGAVFVALALALALAIHRRSSNTAASPEAAIVPERIVERGMSLGDANYSADGDADGELVESIVLPSEGCAAANTRRLGSGLAVRHAWADVDR